MPPARFSASMRVLNDSFALALNTIKSCLTLFLLSYPYPQVILVAKLEWVNLWGDQSPFRPNGVAFYSDLIHALSSSITSDITLHSPFCFRLDVLRITRFYIE